MERFHRPFWVAAAVAVGLIGPVALAQPEKKDDTALDAGAISGLNPRNLGPSIMSGRISALDAAYDGDDLMIYVGSASGGVWKSKDGGLIFEPVFDDHPQSIGAVRIDPSNPKTVWVGTGESWVRNSVSVGRGVYRTTNGGETWELLGLENTERIARIQVHPKDPMTVWVCATGALFNDHADRGVFKTTDGGKTWKKTLFVDDKSGCADIDLDAQDPKVLYAALWQFRRSAHFFASGGPGSALYRSMDGGETWQKLENGLPTGEKGRIAVASAPSRPSRVYAAVEAKETALYRSDNLGETWSKVNTSFVVTARPFYFAHLVVDPNHHETVYKPGLNLGISKDSGESFTSFFSGGFSFGGVHPDHHALWVNPKDSNHLILGTDGGLYVSHNQGRSFRHVLSLPVSQFYRVSYDLARPYNVYGGLQDNGSWMGPSRKPGGITPHDWDGVGGGDGFWAWRDPADPDFVYSESQGGNITRLHLPTGESRDVKPIPAAGKPKYRFNWNTPMVFSPHQKGTLYLGSQILLRSRDHGESWSEISPDLTTNDPAKQRQAESGGLTTDNSTAENHTTIFWIEESPVKAGVIWVGTDDGNLQVTTNDGASWQNVVGNVPGLPKNTWVSSVTASPFDAGTAFATFDGHYAGDMKTYVYRTTDYGKTWTDLGKAPVEGYAHIVRQDLVNPNLLFLGTEFGLFLSLDAGANWVRFENKFPKQVAVRDLTIHPREGDLIVATHGRGIFILDDLAPLRALTSDVLAKDVVMLPNRPTELTIPSSSFNFGGDGEFTAPNPPEAVEITYYLKKRHVFGDLKLEVYDAAGKLITTLPGGKRRGINRASWEMRLPAPKLPPATNLAGAFQGPRVMEGQYTVKLIKGKETLTSQVAVVPDPRSRHSEADRRLQQATSLQLYGQLEDLTFVVDTVTDARDQARKQAEVLGAKDKTRKDVEAFADALETFRKSLVSTSDAGWLSGDEKLRENLANLFGAIEGYSGRPSETQLDRAKALGEELAAALGQLGTFESRAAALNAALTKKGGQPIQLLTREAWKAKKEKTGAGGGSLAMLPVGYRWH